MSKRTNYHNLSWLDQVSRNVESQQSYYFGPQSYSPHRTKKQKTEPPVLDLTEPSQSPPSAPASSQSISASSATIELVAIPLELARPHPAFERAQRAAARAAAKAKEEAERESKSPERLPSPLELARQAAEAAFIAVLQPLVNTPPVLPIFVEE